MTINLATLALSLFFIACEKTTTPPATATFQFAPVVSGTTQTLNEIRFTGTQTGYIAADDGIYKSTNAGSTWTKVGNTGAFTISAVNENVVYAGGFNGVLLKTTNGGSSWITLTPPVTTANNHVWETYFINETTGYISQGFTAGKIYKTTNGGNSWTETTFTGGGAPISSIQFLNDQTGFITTGDPGTLLKTTNAGATWTASFSNIPGGLTAVFFVNENTGYVGDHNGGIRKTTNGGSSWAVQNTGVSQPIRELHFANESIGIAVGDNGTVLSTSDGGATWKKENTTGATGFVEGVYFVSPSLGFIVGEAGKIIKVTR